MQPSTTFYQVKIQTGWAVTLLGLILSKESLEAIGFSERLFGIIIPEDEKRIS